MYNIGFTEWKKLVVFHWVSAANIKDGILSMKMLRNQPEYLEQIVQ